ncbi:outer membrane siderophore receptor [Thiopseudomonas alkaliphila]|uniref:Outer membrane siderophore receptor n=1 Tax=Thiopseudomonas alkaliphila TaxID=1697053 RepID=A0A0K1XDL2_9GAMM|nr:ligand-gated channel protein [Thiopseudomonas alkaliphila]AKX59416.1 outer membrane siderophore receptor [Thiopseudomonas alkaliphila]
MHPPYVRFSLLTLAITANSYALAASSEPETLQLKETVVTAAGFEQQVKNAPASISVISQQDLAKKSYKDVTDALKDVPGVVVTGGGSSSDISVRGMGAKYTLILVDGRRQDSRSTRPNSDGPGIEQGWIPPIEAIERIEVVRGPMSSLYGSDAMGGVVNIITKKTNQEWRGSLRSEYTAQDTSRSGNYHQTNAYLSGPLVDGVLGLQAYAQTSRRAEDKFSNGYNQQKNDSLTTKLSFTPNEAHQFALEVGKSEQERNARLGRSATRSNSQNDYDRKHLAITHQGNWEGGVANTYLQQEKIENPSRDMEVKNTVLDNQTTLFFDQNITTLGAQYKYEDLHDDGNQLEMALDKNRLTRWSWALFAENEWQLHEDFALTTGLRLDRDQNYGSHWSPRVYGVWNPASLEQWTFKGGVSTGYRSPDLRSAVDNWGQITGGGGDPAIIVGNSNLKPEKSVSTEFGAVWDNLENLSIGATIFQTDFKDKITEERRCTDGDGSKATGACKIGNTSYKFISDRMNVDKAQMRGLEATLDWSITSDLALSSSYTFTHSKQKSGKFKGKPLNKMPKHMINSTLDWTMSDQLNSWARVNYRGKSSEYQGRTTMSKGSPSYTFVDFGGNYKLNKNLTLMAGVYNVFNKVVDYEHYDAVLDGRRYTVGATLSF